MKLEKTGVHTTDSSRHVFARPIKQLNIDRKVEPGIGREGGGRHSYTHISSIARRVRRNTPRNFQ